MTEIEKLVQKAIDGDSSAYTDLYKLARRQVYFICLSLVKNQADAEDLMQETFFTVMVKFPTLTDKNSFQAWVNRIAVNKCKNHLAKRKNISYDEEIEEKEIEIPDEDIILPIPFLTSLLRAEAENLNISQLATSAANAAQMAASTGEPVHSTFSKIIAGIAAAVVGLSVASGTVYRINNNDSHKEEYTYYKALDEEYQMTKNNTLSQADYSSGFWFRSWNKNWNGNEVYFALSDSTNDYYRYSEDTNEVKLIIPIKSKAEFNINGVNREYEIEQQNYAYICGYIYTTAYLSRNSESSRELQFIPAILRYDTEGNLLDYVTVPDHTESNPDSCNFAINIISDSGKIYFNHFDFSDTNAIYFNLDPIDMEYYRCNLYLSDLENKLPINDDLMCCYNNTLYTCDEDFNYSAYKEDTFEIIEDDYFIENDLALWWTVGKYVITFDGSIYDMDKKEILADIPNSIDTGYASYYGGDHHFYENKMFRISSERDYENNKIPMEEATVFEPSKYIINIAMLSDDEYLLFEPEGTYFCRISTGKKEKIIFPWSTPDNTEAKQDQ